MEKRIGTHLVFLAALIVSVSVSGQTIRLVSPLNNGVGRLEVFHNGTWGTVCDDGFRADEAKVACRQLGRYNSGLAPRAIEHFGFGGGKIWLDDVSCSGTESSLASCSHNTWGVNDCSHSEDVGIICDPSWFEDLRVRCVVDDVNPSTHTFQWSHNGQTSTGSTFLKRNISMSDQGELTCTADNGHMMTLGRAATAIHITFVSASGTVIHLEPQGSVLNVLLGQVISVVCVVNYSNSPVTSFRWTHNGHSYSGQAFSKTVTSKSDSGSLTCSVGNVHASTRINVWYPPVVHLEPRNGTLNVGVGEDLSVRCVVNDSNPSVHTVRWSHNGQSYNGSTFLKRNISKSDQGQLTCTADNGHMMTPGRAVATVNVRYPPVVHMEPRNRTLNVGVGEDLSVWCVVDDGNPRVHTVRWSHNGKTVTGHGSTFLKRNITKSDQGELICTADNGHMMTPGRAVATVNVRYPPVVHMEPRNGTLNVGVGEDLSVRCVVDDGNPSVHTVRWSHNGQSYNGSTFLKRNITKSDQGQLTCTADNGHMMTPGRAVATVNVIYPPEIHLSPRQDVISVMAGDAVEVECVVDDANPAVTSYTWCHNNYFSHGQTFMKHVSPDDAGNLSCSATNEQGTSTVQTRIRVLQVSSLIGSDGTISENKLIAIVTGSVGIVIIIILIIIIIHLRRRLHAAKSEHEPQRSEQTSRADEIPARCCNYETMERPSGGDENTYCEVGLSETTDGNPAHVYGNSGFEDEENIGTASGTNYGNIQLEMSENIRPKKGKKKKMRSPKEQAYNDDTNPAHIYGNSGFEDEENMRQKKGTASGTNYGNIQLEMSENIRQNRGKERKVKSPKEQAYNDEPVYQNTTSRNQSSM